MVYSVGIDLVDINRIRKGYNRFRSRYLERLFSNDEIRQLKAKKAAITPTMAGKFAAKEAVIKALGFFFDSGVTLKDIEVLSYPSGMPFVRIPEGLRNRIQGKRIIITISHERRYAVAAAMITDEVEK